jgi:hypothetical protein
VFRRFWKILSTNPFKCGKTVRKIMNKWKSFIDVVNDFYSALDDIYDRLNGKSLDTAVEKFTNSVDPHEA